MLITPYTNTGALWQRKPKTKAENVLFAGRIELTPDLINAAQESGEAVVYAVRNPDKTNPRARSVPDLLLYVASQPLELEPPIAAGDEEDEEE
jgi:hypothetical protein